MTDKADDVKVQLFALVPSEMFVGRAWLSETAKDALHLINTQAAEIAALKTSRASIDQMRAHNQRGRELADELEELMGEMWIVNRGLCDIVAHLRGDKP